MDSNLRPRSGRFSSNLGMGRAYSVESVSDSLSCSKSSKPRSSSTSRSKIPQGHSYRTPIQGPSTSRNVLQPLTYSSRLSRSSSKHQGNNAASPGVSRYSMSKPIKDSRPLTDRAWQLAQTKKLLDFLRENQYPNSALTSKSFPLCATEFRNVFNFLYDFLSPGSSLPLKFETEILTLLKALNYPGTLSKSTFMTLGSLHSWPAVLGILVFIKDKVVYFKSLDEKLFFVKTDDNGFIEEDKGFSDDKIFVELCLDTYSKFMAGEENFEEEFENLETHFRDKHQLDSAKYDKLMQVKKEMKDTLQKLKAESDVFISLNKKRELIRTDLERLNDYKDKSMEYMKKKNTELSSLVKKNEILQGSIKEMQCSVEEKRAEVLDGFEHGNYEAQTNLLKEEIDALKDDNKQLDEEICNLEINIGKAKAQNDSEVRDYNLILDEFEGPESLRISNINDCDDENYQSKLLELIATTKKEYRLAQEELEQSQSALEKLRLSNHKGKEQFEKNSKNLKLRQIEYNNCLTSINAEESKIDHKIHKMRETLLQLDNSPKPQIEILKGKVDELEAENHEKRERNLKRGKDAIIFLEKSQSAAIAYVEEATDMRMKQYKKIDEVLDSNYEKKKSCYKQVLKHLEYIRNKESNSG